MINWLIKIEEMAGRVYKEAARKFTADKEFSSLLSSLAKDEAMHGGSLIKASSILKAGGGEGGVGEGGEGKEALPDILYIDEDSKKGIEDTLKKVLERLPEGDMTEAEMVEAMVESEFSEWNDWFIFIMNTVREKGGMLIPAVTDIQQHKRKIERFLESRPEYEGHLERMRRLPSVWEEKFLVIDDDVAITNVLAAVLMDEGAVERVTNVKDAMKRLNAGYYAVIISDVNLPHMSGIEFYRKAVEKYPNIKERFIFFTGSYSEERSAFFKETGVRCLKKPFQIKEMRQAVVDILMR